MDDKMNLSEKDDPKKGAKGGAGKVFFRKKVCRFCVNGAKADYKDPETLKHQRMLAREIKKARVLAYLPFAKK